MIGPQQIELSVKRFVLLERLAILDSDASASPITITLPFRLRRRGQETRIIVGHETLPATVDKTLVDTLSRAHHWLAQLTSGQSLTIAELAKEEGIDDGEISHILPLAFLAPEITEAIVEGRQPVELTARHLKRLKPLPLSWAEQRRALGLAHLSE